MKSATILALVGALAGAPAFAAGPPDPDWPCIQRRQPALSIGQVWGGPPPDAAAEGKATQGEVQNLAHVIALRRTDMAEVEALVAKFAEDADAPALTGLFLATFGEIQAQRNRVMSGITRYAHKQEALDIRINEMRRDFDKLMAVDDKDKDFDAIDKLEQEIDWSTRIFQDRQQSLTYVCETPVILEQRAFAIGRAIAAKLPQ